MFVALIGVVFVVVGMVSGAVLVLEPFGVGSLEAGTALWIMFPVFTGVGYFLMVAGGRSARLGMLSVAVGGGLLLLAAVAGVGLFLRSTGMVEGTGSTESLWYVLVLGSLTGFFGVARGGDSESPPVKPAP